MQIDDVKEAVVGYIRDRFLVGRVASSVSESDSLLEKGVLDSTGVLEIVGFLEEKFMLKVEDEELVPENLESIRNIVAFVFRKKGLAAL